MTVRYVGKGHYFQGVPARDLTDEEWDALPKRRQERLLASGLYEKVRTRRVIPVEEVDDGN